jgi:hypothetical protein
MNRQVERMVRSHDVQAAHACARALNGPSVCCGALRGQRQALLGRRERADRAAQDAHAHGLPGRDRGQQGLASGAAIERAF